MRIISIFLLCAATVLGQATPATYFSEYFDSSTPTGQWTIASSDAAAMAWYSGAQAPGMYTLAYGGPELLTLPGMLELQSFTF